VISEIIEGYPEDFGFEILLSKKHGCPPKIRMSCNLGMDITERPALLALAKHRNGVLVLDLLS